MGRLSRSTDEVQRGRRVFYLTLHGVGDSPRALEPGERAVWLSSSVLKRVLDEARGRSDLHITVDDGNRSDTQILLDELARRELFASFFVVAGRIGKRDFLTAEDVRAIVDAGHSLGSHGLTHRPWRELDRDELTDELTTAREMLEAIVGQPVTGLACPFGSYDRHVLRRARKLGYERVFTSDGGPADPRAWLRPRTTISSLGQPPVAELVRNSPRIAIARRARQTVKRWR